tara:strand:+ start:63117 stop:63545 length:429 start_codon:yes stop_codon:yes gene_type:complete
MFKKILPLLFVVTFLTSCQKKEIKKTKTITLLETTQSWNGKTLPSFPEGQPKITVSKITIPSKTKLPKHLHPLLTMGVITKGELTIVDVDNNKTTIKKVGDALIEVTNTIHYGENKGDEPVEIIVFYAGNETTPTTLLIKEN